MIGGAKPVRECLRVRVVRVCEAVVRCNLCGDSLYMVE
jgi:hypothetical protein